MRFTCDRPLDVRSKSELSEVHVWSLINSSSFGRRPSKRSTMIGVNSIPSSGRMRSRSLCSVRSGRDSKETDPFRYPRTPRSRSLKPLAFPDLLGKTQDGQQHRQSRKKKVENVAFPNGQQGALKHHKNQKCTFAGQKNIKLFQLKHTHTNNKRSERKII